jgi:hypothetical protein
VFLLNIQKTLDQFKQLELFAKSWRTFTAGIGGYIAAAGSKTACDYVPDSILNVSLANCHQAGTIWANPR